MNKKTSFSTLIDLTQIRVDKAGNQLGKLIAERQNAEQQLTMLREYRHDYSDRLNDVSQHGITASNYHNFTRFIATLDEAIVQQTKVVAHLDHNIATSQQVWRGEQRRLHSYETLQTRRKQQHMTLEQRREQIISDEFSAAIYRRTASDRG